MKNFDKTKKNMRPQRGTLISGVQDEDVVQALRTWYNAQDLSLDFEQHILLVDKNDPPLEEFNDPHPLEHVAHLEYEYDEHYKELRILSGSAAFQRPPPYNEAAEWERTTTVDESRYFYLTHLGPHFDMNQWLSFHVQEVSLGELLEVALPLKVKSYLERQNINPPLPPLLDCAASILSGLLGHWLEHLHPPVYRGRPYEGEAIWAHYHGKRFRSQYERAREDMECNRLLAERLSHFTSERLLMTLFKFNSMMDWVQANCIQGGTAQDYRLYMQMYPEARYAPRYFLEIPCWDVPNSDLMPVYDEGMLHVPCYWRAVLPWLQQRWRSFRDRSYAQWKHAIDAQRIPQAIRVMFDAQAQELYRHYLEEHSSPTHKQQQQQQQRTSATAGATGPRVDVPDIEDIWDLLPPCTYALRQSGKFPKNWERLQLSGMLWFGGVAAPTISNFFTHLNDCDPNNESMVLRFNVADHLQRADADIGKYKTWCLQIIGDTVDGNTNGMHCPFVEDVQRQSPQLVADFKMKPKTQRGGHALVRTCNDLCNNGRSFGGSPAHLVQKALVRKKKGEEFVAPAAAAPAAAPVVPDDYSGRDYLADADELDLEDNADLLLTEGGLIADADDDDDDDE